MQDDTSISFLEKPCAMGQADDTLRHYPPPRVRTEPTRGIPVCAVFDVPATGQSRVIFFSIWDRREGCSQRRKDRARRRLARGAAAGGLTPAIDDERVLGI